MKQLLIWLAVVALALTEAKAATISVPGPRHDRSARRHTGIPSFDQAADGTIYAVHDHDRLGSQEVLVSNFTEADVLAGKLVTPTSRLSRLVTNRTTPTIRPGKIVKASTFGFEPGDSTEALKAAVRGTFDPAQVSGGVAPREMELKLPPNPLEKAATWERPKTTRRYFQGPFSERLLVYWREGKILFGENEHRDDWSVEYPQLVSHAAWLVHGDEPRAFDFREAQLSLSAGGEPDCEQTWEYERLQVRLAACAPWGRKPSAHLRLQVTNTANFERSEVLGFMLRCAPEKSLAMGAPDVYESYLPRLEDWLKLDASNWRREGATMRCGDRFARVEGMDFNWDAKFGIVRLPMTLQAGETKVVELELGRGEVDGQNFSLAHASMVENWTAELAKIKLPAALERDSEKRRLVRHLCTQMLQCFAYPVGADYVLPRQGGLQRYVWPGDAVSFLGAMDELGYGEYVARAIDFYFERCLRPTGEAEPFKNRWACDTGCVLETFAKHVLLTGDTACWRRHRDAAFRAFDWIQSKRQEGGGLFPAMKSTDHGASSRHWGFTDMYSLLGLSELAQAAERMRDGRAAEVRQAATAYRAAINQILDGWKAKSAGSDELYIPLTAEGEADDELMEDYMFISHFGTFARFGFLSVEDMHRVRRWMLRRKYADKNGLYTNQVSRRGQIRDEHIWYTTWQDQHWFEAWLNVGRRDLAELTLTANLKFALTEEFLVGERYHDADPWYYPWSPNASGSGRIVQMLLRSVNSLPFAGGIQHEIDRVAAAGGGKVVIPAGEWVTGALELKSNVELNLAEGARLVFPDDPALYPDRMGMYEGLARNRPAPLIGANGATNVAVTGKGELYAIADYWQRNYRTVNHRRPVFLQFLNCAHVKIEDVRIRNSPAWTMHFALTDDVIVRRVNSVALGRNNDGIDLESVNGALIEDCFLDQGDDAICMKSGKNAEGRARNRPTRNVTVRRCTIGHGHTLLGLGSELSGGIENISLEDCVVTGEVWRVVFVKTNRARGGYVRNISVRNVRARRAKCAIAGITCNYSPKNPENWQTAPKFTTIENILVENVVCDRAWYAYELDAKEATVAPKGITIRNCLVRHPDRGHSRVVNIEDLKTESVVSDVGPIAVWASDPDSCYHLGDQATFQVKVFASVTEAETILTDDAGKVISRQTVDLSKSKSFKIEGGTLEVPGHLTLTVKCGEATKSHEIVFIKE